MRFRRFFLRRYSIVSVYPTRNVVNVVSHHITLRNARKASDFYACMAASHIRDRSVRPTYHILDRV